MKLTNEQLQWLRMVKETIVTSFPIDQDDLNLYPFNAHGEPDIMWHLCGNQTCGIKDELNAKLAA